jgi:Inositol monophosphatase family
LGGFPGYVQQIILNNNNNIDGTTNFVHGFPNVCISLGLIDQRVPVLGVIYNPFLDHLYTGVRGDGSYIHTRLHPEPQRLPLAPVSARPLLSLAGALIAVEWGPDRRPEAIRQRVNSFARLVGAPPDGVMAHSLRSVSSAALNLALVAQGAVDLYWSVFLLLVLISFRGRLKIFRLMAPLFIGRLDAGKRLTFFCFPQFLSLTQECGLLFFLFPSKALGCLRCVVLKLLHFRQVF